MVSSDNLEGAQTSPSAIGTARGLFALLWRTALLLLSALLTVAAVAWFVPEANDYASASAKKHERLASLQAPKIVVIGGSNLAFGLDSEMIEQATGRKVVNMGMDAFLGLDFMMAEVEPFIEASDLVVVVLEYDSYYWDTRGVSENQFAVVKANPAAWGYLTDEQRWGVLSVFPRVAQAKVARLLVDSARSLRRVVKGAEFRSAGQLSEDIGSVKGFNAHGDLTAHLDTEWPDERFDGLDLRLGPLNKGTLERLKNFRQRMRERGVEVMLSYPPTTESYYARFRGEIEGIHELATSFAELPTPNAPSEFVYPETWFFDTVYHLMRHGRSVRTARLVQGISKVLSGQPTNH